VRERPGACRHQIWTFKSGGLPRHSSKTRFTPRRESVKHREAEQGSGLTIYGSCAHSHATALPIDRFKNRDWRSLITATGKRELASQR